MINKLYIELALCSTNINLNRKILPRHKRSSRGIYAGEAKYQTGAVYDLINKTYDPYEVSDIPLAHDSFINDLKISEEKKDQLLLASNAIYMILTDDLRSLNEYCFSQSYAYFSFVDEEERTVFSSPYMTSSLLFNPNEEESTYCMVSAKSYPNWDHCVHPMSSELANIFKKNDLRVLNEETKIADTASLGKQSNWSKQAIINSLLNYYENNRYGPDNLANLKSVYEETPTTGAMLGNIFSISTYELKGFSYVSPGHSEIHF